MKLKGGIALIKSSFLSFTASRGFYWTLTFGWMLTPLIYMFVWVSATGDSGISGFNKTDFITYYIIMMVVNQITYPISHWSVGDRIFDGTFSTWLLRPLPTIYEAIAGDIAMKVACAPFILIFILITFICFGFKFSVELSLIGVFILSVILAQILRFMLAYCLSLFALMTNKINSLLTINDTLLFLLAGQVVPTVLLPGIVKSISYYLPFRYMLGFPVEIFIGKLSTEDIMQGFIIQLIWIVFALIAHRIVYRVGVKHYSAIGG